MVAVSAPRFAPLPRGVTGTLCSPDEVPAGLGQFTVAGDGDGGVVIVRADPRIAVSGRLLRDWHEEAPGFITLECHGEPDHAGDVIRAAAAGERAVYVVTGMTDRVHGVWEARWPD